MAKRVRLGCIRRMDPPFRIRGGPEDLRHRVTTQRAAHTAVLGPRRDGRGGRPDPLHWGLGREQDASTLAPRGPPVVPPPRRPSRHRSPPAQRPALPLRRPVPETHELVVRQRASRHSGTYRTRLAQISPELTATADDEVLMAHATAGGSAVPLRPAQGVLERR
jgi:hypothetical protein